MIYLTAAAALAGVITFLVSAVASGFKRLRGRRRLVYELLTSVPLLPNAPEIKSAGLRVTHHDTELKDPYIIEIQLMSKSWRDIPTSAYDQKRPLSLNTGAPIIALLETSYVPDEKPLPNITTSDSLLQIGPDLIRGRQEMTFYVLTDGPVNSLEVGDNPLIDYKVRNADNYRARLIRNVELRKIVAWAVVVFLAWYLFTDPTGAGNAFHNLGNLLQQAGSSIATFLNSL